MGSFFRPSLAAAMPLPSFIECRVRPVRFCVRAFGFASRTRTRSFGAVSRSQWQVDVSLSSFFACLWCALSLSVGLAVGSWYIATAGAQQQQQRRGSPASAVGPLFAKPLAYDVTYKPTANSSVVLNLDVPGETTKVTH